MSQPVFLSQENSGRLAADLQDRDPGLVEPEPDGEPGTFVEGDRLGEVPDGEEDVVEAEQFVRLFI